MQPLPRDNVIPREDDYKCKNTKSYWRNQKNCENIENCQVCKFKHRINEGQNKTTWTLSHNTIGLVNVVVMCLASDIHSFPSFTVSCTQNILIGKTDSNPISLIIQSSKISYIACISMDTLLLQLFTIVHYSKFCMFKLSFRMPFCIVHLPSWTMLTAAKQYLSWGHPWVRATYCFPFLKL